jgi:hypothetical protein
MANRPASQRCCTARVTRPGVRPHSAEQGSGVVQHTAENLLAQQGTLYQLEGTVASLFGRHYYDTAVWEQRAG